MNPVSMIIGAILFMTGLALLILSRGVDLTLLRFGLGLAGMVIGVRGVMMLWAVATARRQGTEH